VQVKGLNFKVYLELYVYHDLAYLRTVGQENAAKRALITEKVVGKPQDLPGVD